MVVPLKFKHRNLREIAETIIGDAQHFDYRSSSYITEFFDECGVSFIHDGSTRWHWTCERLGELLAEPSPTPYALPNRFVHVLRVLMHLSDAPDDDVSNERRLTDLNRALRREGYEAFYGEDRQLYLRHIGSKTLSNSPSPHRAFTQEEIKRRDTLAHYLDVCSEDDFIEEVLLPLFRQLGFQRITAAGHKDKALEYGKDVWMKHVLPTQHVLYFGIQVKKGKLDSAGASKRSNANVAEILNQVSMMLGHEVFDPETSRRVLVDHAFIIAGGEITKQAKNWLGEKLDSSKRSQILFMDRADVLDLYTDSNIPLPEAAKAASVDELNDELPF